MHVTDTCQLLDQPYLIGLLVNRQYEMDGDKPNDYLHTRVQQQCETVAATIDEHQFARSTEEHG